MKFFKHLVRSILNRTLCHKVNLMLVYVSLYLFVGLLFELYHWNVKSSIPVTYGTESQLATPVLSVMYKN